MQSWRILFPVALKSKKNLSSSLLVFDSVHDGWGIATTPGLKDPAIDTGITTNMDTIAKNHSMRKLPAHPPA
ncbi:hypothetical protein MPER_13714, partial [Moniliophthora perniciosa FA553]